MTDLNAIRTLPVYQGFLEAVKRSSKEDTRIYRFPLPDGTELAFIGYLGRMINVTLSRNLQLLGSFTVTDGICVGFLGNEIYSGFGNDVAKKVFNQSYAVSAFILSCDDYVIRGF